MPNKPQIKDDLTFISQTENWPQWPILPIKMRQPTGMPRCTVLVDKDNGALLIADPDTNMFQLSRDTKFRPITAVEVINAGWMVD